MKTAELTGAALDWAVARITNPQWWEDGYMDGDPLAALNMDDGTRYSPSTDWAQGGPIIEREGISVLHTTMRLSHAWEASQTPAEDLSVCEFGPTPLVAAMRCYVASKLGDEVEVPDELMEAA